VCSYESLNRVRTVRCVDIRDALEHTPVRAPDVAVGENGLEARQVVERAENPRQLLLPSRWTWGELEAAPGAGFLESGEVVDQQQEVPPTRRRTEEEMFQDDRHNTGMAWRRPEVAFNTGSAMKRYRLAKDAGEDRPE